MNMLKEGTDLFIISNSDSPGIILTLWGYYLNPLCISLSYCLENMDSGIIRRKPLERLRGESPYFHLLTISPFCHGILYGWSLFISSLSSEVKEEENPY